MRSPAISLTCDCGARGQVRYGERWTCPECGKTYDTTRIPAEDYEALVRGVRRYKWLTVGPPLVATAILAPATILGDIRYAFLLFFLVMGWGLLVLPRLRARATARVMGLSARWEIEAD